MCGFWNTYDLRTHVYLQYIKVTARIGYDMHDTHNSHIHRDSHQ